MPPTTQASVDPNDPSVIALSKAIFKHESNNDFNAVGDAGTSHGAGQWQPETWKGEAADILGDQNAQMTPENQKAVIQGTIAKWKAQGLNPAQIAAKWNSGSENGWENKIGVATINGQRVPYNVPSYVKSVTELYQQYKPGSGNLPAAPQAAPTYSSDMPDTAAPSDQKKGFLQSIGDDTTSALTGAGSALSRAGTGEINPLSGVLQAAGSLAGGVTSGINDVATHIPVVGDVVSGAEGLIGKGVQAAANTGAGKALLGGVSDFSSAHPELSGDIGAAGNIAGLIGTFTGAGAVKDAVGSSLAKAVGKDALSSTIDAISPEIKAGTKAGVKDIAQNGVSKGPLGTVTRNVDPALRDAAAVVQEVAPKFDKMRTFADRFNAVKGGIKTLAEKLESNLKTPELQPLLTPDDLNVLEKGITDEIGRNPLLTGDAGLNAQKIFNEFKRLLPQQGDITMSDVLAARKKLDQWIGNIKGDTAFDPKMENALSVGLRAVRQGANNLMETKVPDAGVKELLKKQSLLYDALENLAPKADKEVGSGILGRAVARHPYVAGAAKYAGGALLTGLGFGEAQHLLGNK